MSRSGSMDALLRAAADDIKLIDCLGPEDLCLDRTAADGLKPLQSHGLRSRSTRTAANAEATAGGSSIHELLPAPLRRRLSQVPTDRKMHQEEAARAPAIQHGSANAHLAAALSAGDFCAPESPPPVSTRPVHMPALTVSPKYVRPATKEAPPVPKPVPGEAAPAAAAKAVNRGSSSQPMTRVQRFAASILHYLHDNLKNDKTETLESVVRRDFGNNPDISKALRLLVSEKRVKRVGKGGRADPFTYQLAPKADETSQEGQRSSRTLPDQAASGNHGSSGPPTEAGAAVGVGVTAGSRAADASQVKPKPAVIDSRDLPAMLAVVPQYSRQSAELPANPKPAVPQLPDQSALLKHSASLPSSLATLPAAATGVPPSHAAQPLLGPSQSIKGDRLGKERLQSAQHSSELGRSAAYYPFLSVSHGLQSAHSLPLESASKLPPSLPTATSGAAAAAAAGTRHDSPEQGAASFATASAFQPHNRGVSLGSQATGGKSQPSLQHDTSGIPGGTAGRYTHTGAVRGQIDLGSKASTVYNKENFVPAAAAKRGSRLNPHATQNQGLVSMTHMGSMRAPGVVNSSTLSNSRQPVLVPTRFGTLSNPASGTGLGGSAISSVAQGKPANQSHDHMAHASDGAVIQDHSSGGISGPGDSAASKRAKLTH